MKHVKALKKLFWSVETPNSAENLKDDSKSYKKEASKTSEGQQVTKQIQVEMGKERVLEGNGLCSIDRIEPPSSPKHLNGTIESSLALSSTDVTGSSTQTQPFLRRRKENFECRLFLGGLPHDAAETDIRKAFEKYGKVEEIFIMLDKNTKKSRRCGFLEFENEDSAKTCLHDHFVVVNEKRVEVKKVWPRSSRRDAEEKGGKKETNKIGCCIQPSSGSKHLNSNTKSSLASSSTGSEANVEYGQSVYRKVFENYFKSKFFLDNAINSDVRKWSEDIRGYQQAELEKILMDFYICNKKESCARGDGMFFSKGLDETVSTSDEFECSSSQNEMLKIRPAFEKDVPFQNDGLVCILCNFAPLDNSVEGFLAHCGSLPHKRRLQERFNKEETQKCAQDKSLTEENLRKHNQENKQHVHQETRVRGRSRKRLEEPLSRCQQRFCTENLNKSLTEENLRKHNQENKQHVHQETRVRGRSRKRLEEPLSGCQENWNNPVMEDIINLIEGDNKCIKCKICKKTIPQSGNFRIFMVNLSQHLQSKGHLARINEMERLK